MSPQQTMKKRHQMIQETQEFLDQELKGRNAASQCEPRMQFRPPDFDSFSRRSFITTNLVAHSKCPRN